MQLSSKSSCGGDDGLTWNFHEAVNVRRVLTQGRSMAPSPEKIAQKTTFLPAFAVWVGVQIIEIKGQRVDYKDEIN